MNSEDNPLAWVGKAEEDYAMARTSLRRKQPIPYGACFHAQQCAEKYLKAMLVARSKPFPKTHDLIQLSGLCAQAGILVEIDNKRLNTLSDHAVRVRYPGANPSVQDARAALETAKAVRKFARKFLNVK
jgi:HEPN domain-containing protein